MIMNVPFGFYGAGNIGDEATLQGFATLLRDHPRPVQAWVASQNVRHTARIEPAFRYYRYRGGIRGLWPRFIGYVASAYVFAGGTPIMDGLGTWPLCDVVPIVRHARRLGRPVVFVGAGTERLRRPESRRLFSQDLADDVTHWSVRGARDRERLTDSGVAHARVTVAADMAWLLPRSDDAFGQGLLGRHGLRGPPLVGVNINSESSLLEREPRLFEKVATLLDRLIEEHGVRVVFLCNEVREGETFDKATARAVYSHMRRRNGAFALPNEYWGPRRMMSVIASCRLTISTRYHFCLFSAIQGVPFLAIKRSDKVSDLCEDLGWPFGIVPGSFNVEEAEGQAATLLAGRSREADGLTDTVAAMRKRAWDNRAALDAIP